MHPKSRTSGRPNKKPRKNSKIAISPTSRVDKRYGYPEHVDSFQSTGEKSRLDRLFEPSDTMHPFSRISYYEILMEEARECLDLYQGERNVDRERVGVFLAYQVKQIKKHGYPHFPGVLVACRLEGVSKWSLIDGQHRLLCMYHLIDEGICADFPIGIHVIDVKTKKDIHEEFVNINKSVPVPISVLQPNQIVNDAIEILSKKYFNPFTNSVKARRPQIYKDGFKDYLIEQEVVEMKDIETAEELVSLIVRTDDIIKSYGVPKLRRMIGGNHNEYNLIGRLYEKCTKENKMFLSIFKARNPDKRGIWMDIMENLPQKGKEREKEE